MAKFNSCMGRIAQYLDSITDTDEEYDKVSLELHEFWHKDRDYSKLSPKAHATIITWEEERGNVGKTNNNLVNEWESK